MPHIIVEHSRDTGRKIDLAKLARELHMTLSLQETVKLEAIKTRTVAVDNILLGNGDSVDFIHVTVKLLPGRDAALKERMVQAIYQCVLEAAGHEPAIRVSVDLSELGVYIKN
jgi:5-carboxymethyl-2-hydroxymuconate isomerase